jgi:hypothetical protein
MNLDYSFFDCSRAVFIQRVQLFEYQQLLLDPTFKGALLSSEDHIAYLNQKNFPETFFHSANEVFSSFNLCIYMHRQSCLNQKINENILSLQSNGLMQIWAGQFVDYSYLKERTVSEPSSGIDFELCRISS